MAIPIAYNLRNLAVRKTTTIMTALGIGLTVAVLLAVLALVEGLRQAFEASGDPLQIIVMRKGSTSELVSNFSRAQFQDLKFKPGIAKGSKGDPMASLEVITVIALQTKEEGQDNEANITLRGLLPVGVEMRSGLKLEAGRWFQAGRREIVVGKNLVPKYRNMELGQKLRFGRDDWEVVGIMSHGASAVNSEVWADLNQVASDYNRSEVLSSALVRAPDAAGVDALLNDLRSDQRLKVDALTEKAYYAQQTQSSAPIQYLGTFVAVIMAVGSCFAAMNTMYAAVSRRAKEIGTLRVLGFSRSGILFSFFVESVLLSVLGGLLGVLLALPLNNLTTGIGSFTTFSEIQFNLRVTPAIMATGVAFAVFMGVIGGIFPARTAAKKEILTALREV